MNKNIHSLQEKILELNYLIEELKVHGGQVFSIQHYEDLRNQYQEDLSRLKVKIPASPLKKSTAN
jgi:hypothetical protein